MSGNIRASVRATPEIDEIRRALGAVAVAEPAVFWIFGDQDGSWRVRREGAESEKTFDNRRAARAFVELQAARCRSFRIFSQGEAGKFAEECSAWPSELRRLTSNDDGPSHKAP